MSNVAPTVFLDCLGRVIEVGDVLACGQRRGSHGGLRIGVVTGFTKQSILADMLCGYRSNYWDHTELSSSWWLSKGHFNAPYNCLITGYTRDQLLQRTGLDSPQEQQQEEEKTCDASDA